MPLFGGFYGSLKIKLIFKNESITFRQASLSIFKFAANWSKAQQVEFAASSVSPPKGVLASSSRRREGKNLICSPPSASFIKLNFDGSKLAHGNAACGFVLRDSDGTVLLAGAKNLGSSVSILQAEAWGLIEGLKGAAPLSILQLLVEGVNLTIVNAIKNCWSTPLEIDNMICDAEIMMSAFSMCQIDHCFKEANKAANFMANKGHNYSSPVLY